MKVKPNGIWARGIWPKYLNANLLIYGHDSSFGLGGDPENPLGYPIYLPIFAKFLGKKTFFFAGSIPPKPRRLGNLFRFLYSYALKHTTIITLRESNSLKNISKWDDKNYYVTADIAYLLKKIPSSNKYSFRGGDKNRKLIGMTISQVRASIAYKNLDKKKSYERHIIDISIIIKHIIEILEFNVVLIPHCTGVNKTGDDRECYLDINKQVNSDSLFILNEELEPNKIKGIISMCDIMIGERLHSVIAALSCGIPSIAITYKNDVRIGMIDQVLNSKYIICLEDLKQDKLYELIEHIIYNYDEIREEIRINVQKHKAKSSINKLYLKKMLAC